MNTECQITVVNDLKLIRNAIECFSSTKKKEQKQLPAQIKPKISMFYYPETALIFVW